MLLDITVETRAPCKQSRKSFPCRHSYQDTQERGGAMEPFQVRWGCCSAVWVASSAIDNASTEQQNASKVQSARHACRIEKKAKDCGQRGGATYGGRHSLWTYPGRARSGRCSAPSAPAGSEFVCAPHPQQPEKWNKGRRRKQTEPEPQLSITDGDVTLTHGGMTMLRLHRTCWTSSYLVHLRRKDRKPAASLLPSLT